MIVRKPYAFLIKHFRMIHLFLFICLGVILANSVSLMNFLDDYEKTGKFVYNSMLQSKYIPAYLFFLCFLVFALAAVVDYLMKWKKKKRAYYIAIIVFYLSLIIVLIVYRSFLGKILLVQYGDKVIRAYRDIITLFTYPQYYFAIIALLRAIGFNLKKFDFKKDAAELNIDTSDNEEVEVVFKSNSYKIKRSIRKFFRDLKYNLVEYKYLYFILLFIVISISSFIGYKKLYLDKKMIKENDYFSINDVEFSVESSFITNKDYKGNIIKKNRYYVVVLVNMFNLGDYDTSLKLENFNLKIGSKVINSSLTYAKNFIDLGKYYNNQTIYSKDENLYYFVFEIKKEEKRDNYTFQITNTEDGANTKILIKPEDVSKIDEKDYNMMENIVFDESDLLNTSIIFNNYDLGYKFIENYEYCISNCYNAKYVVFTKNVNTSKKILLKLNIDYFYDNNLNFITNIPEISDFISKFGSITYILNDVKNTTEVDIITNKYISKNNIYLEVPDEIKDASNIWLNLTIRNKKYNILIK